LDKTAAVVGEICIDNYLYPVRKKYVGGNALNVAFGLLNYEIDTSLLGAIGTDEGAEEILNTLKKTNIEISHLKIVKGETAHTDVEIRNAERIIIKEKFGVLGSYQLDEEDVKFISKHNLVHITLNGNGEIKKYIDFLKKQGLIISIDYSTGNDVNFIKETLEFADIVFLSKSEKKSVDIEKLGEKIVKKGPRIAVITMGEKGSIAFTHEEMIYQPAIPVDNLVDTLGAGDAFISAFLSSLLKKVPIKKALEEGAFYASKICQHVGGWILNGEKTDAQR